METKKGFFAELWSRISKEETPDFWKKIRNFAVILVAIATALISLNATGIPIPEQVITYCGYVLTIATTLGIAAQTTSTGKTKTEVKTESDVQ